MTESHRNENCPACEAIRRRAEQWPDLVAALELMLAVYAPLYRPAEVIDAFSSAVIKARTALAKARGQ